MPSGRPVWTNNSRHHDACWPAIDLVGQTGDYRDNYAAWLRVRESLAVLAP